MGELVEKSKKIAAGKQLRTWMSIILRMAWRGIAADWWYTLGIAVVLLLIWTNYTDHTGPDGTTLFLLALLVLITIWNNAIAVTRKKMTTDIVDLFGQIDEIIEKEGVLGRLDYIRLSRRLEERMTKTWGW